MSHSIAFWLDCTGLLHIMQGHLIFLVGGGLRFFPDKIAPAMRSRVFCSFIWEASVINSIDNFGTKSKTKTVDLDQAVPKSKSDQRISNADTRRISNSFG